MIEIKQKKECCGCHACYNICPHNAIEMAEDEKGLLYPKLNEEKCIKCGLCKKVCPILNTDKIQNIPEAYASINKNEQIRQESSSGGIFTLIAEQILDKNGVVFGAAFNEKFEVNHCVVKNKEELDKLRGSKYVQSKIKDTYKEAKKYLEEDYYVLFTGTPCQIEGLKRFLMKNYDKLYTQDIICHGVPSPKVWKEYVEFRKEKDNQEPIEISFRNKEEYGWKKFSMMFKYEKGKYTSNLKEDYFMKLFLTNVILRDSCYECSFKKKNRVSDITLADFWGVEDILPEMDDNKGTSLVIVNSKKGREIFEKISNNVISKKIDLEQAIVYNSAMISSVYKSKNSDAFWKKFNKESVDKLSKKYANYKKENIIIRILRKIKNILKAFIKNIERD